MSFRSRVILGITALLLILVFLLIGAGVHAVRTSNLQGLKAHTDATADLFAELTLEPVLTQDLARLQELTAKLANQPDLAYVHVMNADGTKLASSIKDGVDLDHDILVGSAPIEVAGKKFGVVEIGLSSLAIEEAAASVIRSFSLIGLIGVALTAVFAYLMGTALGRRLDLLGDGANRLSQGELGFQIPVDRDDELGRVAAGFNRMSGDLKTLYGELESYTKRFKAVSNSIPGAVYQRVTYPGGKSELTYFSEGIERLYGVRAEDLIRDADIMRDLIHPDDRDAFYAEIRGSVENKNPFRIEFRIETPQGQQKWIRADASCSERQDGTVVLDGMVLDVTKDRELDQIKSEFISVVNHELRTPLTSIQGSLSMIAHAPDDAITAKYRNLVDIADRNCARLVRLVNDILDLDKIASGHMVLTPSPTSVDGLLQTALDSIQPFADSMGKSVVIARLVPGIEIAVDHDRIIQVLTNLISNAVKFELEGGTVLIAADIMDQTVRFSVTDHGEGVPEIFGHRIFDKFTQAETALTRNHDGSGLGLSIAKTIVEAHDGVIDFRSDNGETVFWFDLPLAGVGTPEGRG